VSDVRELSHQVTGLYTNHYEELIRDWIHLLPN